MDAKKKKILIGVLGVAFIITIVATVKAAAKAKSSKISGNGSDTPAPHVATQEELALAKKITDANPNNIAAVVCGVSYTASGLMSDPNKVLTVGQNGQPVTAIQSLIKSGRFL